MRIFASILILWMFVLTLAQSRMLWLYLKSLRLKSDLNLPAAAHPPMLAVLCLRGADPFLRECIRRLVDSDYPALTVRIVIDSDSDPALEIVTAVLVARPDARVEVKVLPDRLLRCSGKVSSLLHATDSLPDGCEIVAWIDGDSMLHASALRELAAGLTNKHIGATSGNRWYVPPDAGLSGLTRMCWNGFAVPTMNMFGILWGGCMATRADYFRDPVLRSLLANSFIEDSTISSYVRSHGMKTQMIGSAMLVNQESISFTNQYRFAVRQLFTVRIDNSRWPWLSSYMLALNSTLLFGLILLILPGVYAREWLGAAYLLLLTVTVSAIPIGHLNVRRILTSRDESFPKLTWSQLAMMPAAIMVPNQLNLASTIHSFFIHRLTWRGITYQFARQPKCTVIDARSLAIQADAKLVQSVA